MFNSPFEEKKSIDIPSEVEIIFCCDLFVSDYAGGAELTSEAFIESSPFKCYRLKASDVTMEVLEKYHNKYWIFGNFASLNPDLWPTIVRNLKYSILEYDYKLCRYRSPEKHKFETGKDCDCADDIHGKMISAFFYGAQSIYWMSEAQQKYYESNYPFLRDVTSLVISSTFTEGFWKALNAIRNKNKNFERKGWIVLGSDSWIKGKQNAIDWCKENGHDYQVIWNQPYEVVLTALSQAEGFVYLPNGMDTCPRMVIEAKLLGCKLHLNDYVQHKDEEWFTTDDMWETEAYLYAARETFWNSVSYHMNPTFKLSGYTTTYNCEERFYPYIASIKSMAGFCDEVIVLDAGSSDGTFEKLNNTFKEYENVHIHQHKVDFNNPRWAIDSDGHQKARARDLCTGDFCWQQDIDEIVHEKDYQKIRDILRTFPKNVPIISLPIIEFWGGLDKIRMDINPWKWRISRNDESITHGVPQELRRYDDDGNMFALPGTDSCDYIDKETGVRIHHASFYTEDVHNLRSDGLQGNEEARLKYENWLKNAIEVLPTVYHYSWFNIENKIKSYKNYWGSFWKSMYNTSIEDTAENNVVFDKPWSEVTDEDITSMSKKLKESFGGWIFHQKPRWDVKVPYVSIDITEPKVMNENSN